MIRLTLPLPPSANQLYRAQVVRGVPTIIKAKGYRAYERDAGSTILVQHKPHKNLPDAPLSFTAKFYWPDRRIRDTDNPLKALVDVVSRALGFDDSQVSEIHAYRLHCKKNPRCEVEIATASGMKETA
jgi:crossover junction endodeoxyribonuclease RusA